MSDVRKQAQSLVDLGAKATTHHGLWLAEKTNGKGEPVLAVWASEGGIVCKVQTTRFEPATYHNPEFIAACGNHAPGIARAYLAECEAHERTRERSAQAERLLLLASDALMQIRDYWNGYSESAVDACEENRNGADEALGEMADFLASIEQKEGVSK